MLRRNASPELAFTGDPETHEDVFAAAAREGLSVSARMTTGAREALHRRAGLAAVARWERQHGDFTPEEMDEAAAVCGRRFAVLYHRRGVLYKPIYLSGR